MSDDTSAKSASITAPTESLPQGNGLASIDAKVTEGTTSTSNGVEATKALKEASKTDIGEDANVSENLVGEEKLATDDKALPAAEHSAMQVDNKTEAPEPVADGAEDIGVATPTSNDKSGARRKSGGVPEHRGKKLNKKQSKAKMTHIDAKPGDHFFIKLKGYPLWPGIICDESMLPNELKNHRPVTAAREDGTYRPDYEEGGKKINDRTFPVMYLSTNEFGWLPNYDLVVLDKSTVADVPGSMRKDLQLAHQLASEDHDLDYYKKVLKDHELEKAAAIEAAELAKAEKEAAKEAAKAAKKVKRKSTLSKVTAVDEDATQDVEMADADADAEVVEEDTTEKPKPSKKRKTLADENEGASTPGSSVKKPKFKPLTSTPKANGTPTPKASTKKEQSATKPKSSKAKKAATNGETAAPISKEPEMTPEEKRQKKEKEILFLRHKLQKGLLTRDQQPKVEEMKQMSEYVNKLEGYADLEVSIIRATKINKVLKAILKLEEIPKETEFKFKERSQSLLEKWNKILEGAAAPTAVPVVTDDATAKVATNGTPKPEEKQEKPSPVAESADAADTPVDDIPSRDESKVDASPETTVETTKPSATDATTIEATA